MSALLYRMRSFRRKQMQRINKIIGVNVAAGDPDRAFNKICFQGEVHDVGFVNDREEA